MLQARAGDIFVVSDNLAFDRDQVCEHRSLPGQVPILFCNAAYGGTLAAMRSLGRAGVPLITVDPSMLAPGRYSRFSALHLSCPPFEMTGALVEWLLRLGRSGPRRVLYATSDAVSFALARHRDELQPYFHLYQPDLDAIMGILDKGALLQHARNAGFDTPETWLPQSAEDAARIARDVGDTLLIKPRSQLAVRNYSKGVVIEAGAGDVHAAYDGMMRLGAHDGNFAKQYPAAMLPMLQRYHSEGAQIVFSLSGFRDVTGRLVSMRGTHKVLQRPRRLGVGLCFEEAKIPPELAESAVRLCESIGYYGIFEIEFILSAGRALLIDFNGRFYNQIAFDIARGMDLPAIAYAAATGNTQELERLVSDAATRTETGEIVYCDRFGLAVTIFAQRAFGTMSPDEANHWRQWRKAHRGKIVDSVYDAADPLPAFVAVARQVLNAVRHPRSFVRQTGLA